MKHVNVGDASGLFCSICGKEIADKKLPGMKRKNESIGDVDLELL